MVMRLPVYARYLLCGLLLTVVILALLLCFGHPQWCRWIYIFQDRVWPPDDHFSRMESWHYTGLWYEWHPDGSLHYIYVAKDGRAHGPAWRFDTEGRLKATAYFVDDELDGPYVLYDADGNMLRQCIFKSGAPYEGTREVGRNTFQVWKAGRPWDGVFDDGHGGNVHIYEEGKLISPAPVSEPSINTLPSTEGGGEAPGK